MNNNKIKLGSNRSFGIVFFVVFLIIAIYPLLNDNSIRLWSLIVGIIFLILGIINSKLLTPFNILWMKFGLLLGKIVSPIVMGFVFFGVVTPISIIMKLLRKDLLNLKRNKKETYWLKKEEIKSNMKKYDCFIFIYHDQALIPFKYISQFSGVNYTGNLSIIRVSPDHGTAYNLIGSKNISNLSLLNCYNLIKKIKKNRKTNDKSKKIT